MQGKMSRMDGRRGTYDLCSRVHCPLEGLAVSSTAVPIPDSDAARQHTLNGAPVECGEDGWWGDLLFSAGGESVGAVVPSWRVTCVGGPGEILCDVHPQEFSAADSLHSRTVDGQWGVVNGDSPEVHHNLLCLLHIEG